MRTPTHNDIAEASARIAPFAFETPLIENTVLNALVGGRVLLKLETLQRVGAFKFRGAYNAVSRLDRAAWTGGVVACSSGNHAQGVAEAARLVGMAAAIVMPSDAPGIKIERTRRSGAEVFLYDRDSEDRDAIAERLCTSRQAALVHPFDDPDIIAGQGTAGLELVRQASALGAGLDAVLVPCGGAGLASGIAIAVKHHHPSCEVYAVEPRDFDDLARSLKSGKREKNEARSGSICDALLSPSVGRITFEIARHHLAGSLAVDDAAVRRAMRFAFTELKLAIEPGGAVALAAVLEGRVETEGRVVAVVLSGGNVEPRQFAEIISGSDPITA